LGVSPLGLLFLTLFNSILGLSILFPILGPLARELGLSEVQVGLFSTGYALMQFLLSPYWGRRSERGRKPILLLGILGFALSFFLFGLFALLGQKGLIPQGLLFPYSSSPGSSAGPSARPPCPRPRPTWPTSRAGKAAPGAWPFWGRPLAWR
jgi:MFS family permease